MPEVGLWSALRAYAGGAERVRVKGRTVGEVLDALAEAYPGMAEVLEDGVSVAVNGQIVAGSRSEPVPEDAEVFVMQRVRGG